VAIIAWPAQVSDAYYSYPFDAVSYTAAQTLLAVHHLGALAGLYGVALLAWSHASRPTKAGLGVAILGMVVLTACEIFAISAAHAQVGTPRADAVYNSYGIAMTLLGVGMVLAGLGLARRPVLPGWGRWVLLTLGVYVFVPLFPAVIGPMVQGRIAIGVWMLLFAALGIALVRAAPD
jgi:hypothetical protein